MVPKRFGGNFRSAKSKILKSLSGCGHQGLGFGYRGRGCWEGVTTIPPRARCTYVYRHAHTQTKQHKRICTQITHVCTDTHAHAHTRRQTTSQEHPERAMCLGLRMRRLMSPSAFAGPTTGLWGWPLEFPGAKVTQTGFERKVSCMQIYSDERSATVLCGFVYIHFFKKKNGFHKRIFGNHLIFNTMFIYKKPHFKPLTVQEKGEASDCMTLANNENLLHLRTSPPS